LSYKVGIPRALLYYQFSTLWRTFFHCLGAETVVSGDTNKLVLDLGTAKIVDEACLPVKIFFGHALRLARENLDYLFVPRMVSIEKKAFICPKTMGLPDMLEASKTPLPPLIKPTMNLVSSQRKIDAFLWETGHFFTADIRKIKRAWREALEQQQKEELQGYYRLWGKNGYNPDAAATRIEREDKLVILLLGHSYLLQDNFLNLNLLEKLKRADCHVITPEQIPSELQEDEVKDLPKRFFWTYGRILMGSARCFSKIPENKGVIILTSFGCGIDSFVDNMVMRYLHKAGIPYLNIILDEHTGEAGVDTRIEAFLDMIRWRRQMDEGNFSSYGPYMGNNERTVGISGAGCDCTPANN